MRTCNPLRRSCAQAFWVFAALVMTAAQPARAQQPNWLGPYLGGQYGYSWDKFTYTTLPTTALDRSETQSSGIGGIVGGANFIQANGFVAGLVADFNWLRVGQGSNTFSTTGTLIDTCGDGCNVQQTTTAQSAIDLKIDWKASLRAKAGVLVTPTVLLYVTGGAAFAQLEAHAARTTVVTLQGVTTVTSASASDSTLLRGLVAGVGVEAFVAPNIAVFSQVLNYQFDAQSLNLLDTVTTLRVRETLITAGVSFYFN